MAKRITINELDFRAAAKENQLSTIATQALWNTLKRRAAQSASISLPNLSYYLGAAFIIIALIWFSDYVISEYHSPGLMLLSGMYTIIMLALGTWLRSNDTFSLLSNLCLTIATLTLMPFVFTLGMSLFGLNHHTLQHVFQYPNLDWHLAVAAALVGFVAATGFFKFTRFPFFTFIMSATLIFIANQLFSLIHHPLDSDFMVWVNIGLGLTLLIAALFCSKFLDDSLFFWPYFFGLLMLYTSLWLLFADGHIKWLEINSWAVACLLVGGLMRRRLLIAAGISILLGYLIQLSYHTIGIYLSVSGIGVLLIGIGVYFTLKKAKTTA